jgi:hypothetical protein
VNRERARSGAAYGALAVTLVFAAVAAGLYVATRSTHVDLGGQSRVIDAAFGAVAAVFAAVGAVIVVRRPGNTVGWLFAGIGLLLSFTSLAEQFAIYAIVGRSSPLRGGATAAWIQSWSTLSTVTFGLALLLLVFPEGRLLTRRWRVVSWIVGAGFCCFFSGYLIDPGPLTSPFSAVDNPFGIAAGQQVASVLVPIGFLCSLIALFAAAISQVLRYRRAGAVERQQIKWLAAAGALAAASLLTSTFLEGMTVAEAISAAIFVGALAAIPASAGMAILRYRLYEIDVVVNRTLVYGALTALLAGTYVVLVLLFQLGLRPLTHGSGGAVALSTLAVAGLFRPARTRIQALVDRRFYRHKYDAERTLAAFAARLRDEVDLDALRGELAAVISETMQPAHISLWLRDGDSVTLPRRFVGTNEPV